VRTTARALLALGVRPGDHVGLWATSWPPWVVVQFAAAQVGAVLVNINPAYRSSELAYVLHQADVSVLLLHDRFKATAFFDVLAAVCPELAAAEPGALRAAACPRLRWVVSIHAAKRPGMLARDEFLARAEAVPGAELDRRAAGVAAADVVNIQYT